MAEALETLQSALAAGMPIPPDILVDLLPIRQDIKKRLKERMEQAQQPDPMEQQAKQVALEQEQAKTGKVKADTFKSTADAVKTISESPLGMGGMTGLPGMEQPAPQAPRLPSGGGAVPSPAKMCIRDRSCMVRRACKVALRS